MAALNAQDLPTEISVHILVTLVTSLLAIGKDLVKFPLDGLAKQQDACVSARQLFAMFYCSIFY